MLAEEVAKPAQELAVVPAEPAALVETKEEALPALAEVKEETDLADL